MDPDGIGRMSNKMQYDRLKEELCKAPVLAHPDNTQSFSLLTDSSQYAVGVILEQNGHPVSYFSKTLSKAEQKYGTSERECLAMILGIKKFSKLIYTSGIFQIKVITRIVMFTMLVST